MSNSTFVHENISIQSRLSPNSIAVKYGHQEITYEELDAFSDRLAFFLISNHQHLNKQNISVFVKPNLMLPVVILGILKAGYSYIPLASYLVPTRVNQIVSDSDSFLTIAFEDLPQTLGFELDGVPLLNIAEFDFSQSMEGYTLPTVTNHSLAYTLYTSGSTGKPKGVEIEHGNLSYYLGWFNHDLWPETHATLPLTSSLNFAAAVTQLFAPLLRGDTLHILPEGILNQPSQLFDWFKSESNTAIYCVPTIWNELLNYSDATNADLVFPRTVFLSGEAVAEDLKARTFSKIPNVRLFNLYGPTETVANCAFTELKADKPVTIGKALRGSELFLLDADGKLIEDGVGEVCIAGPGVARGYSNASSLNQGRFFSHNFQKAHRTGDLGQYDCNGNVIFLGRKDRQVKLNGMRVELGEIESTLRGNPNILDAVVKLSHDRLIAYLLTEKELPTWELRKELLEKCPAAFIPSQFICLESFPKLPNGKLDSARLPDPMSERPPLNSEYQLASNDVEQDLIEIWQEVLGVYGIGVNDDFFDLGGDSIKAIQARTLIRKRLYSDIDFYLFFNNPTPKQLAMVVPYYIADETEDDRVIENSSFTSESKWSTLSPQQSYFLTLDQTSVNPKSYQIAFCIFAHGQVNPDGMVWSVKRVLENNPVLLSQFDLDNLTVTEGGFSIEEIQAQCQTLDGLGRNDAQAGQSPLNVEWLLEQVELADIDLDYTPPISIALISTGKEEYALLVRVHHTVFDHESISLFYAQFVQAYQAYLVGDRNYSSHVHHHYNPYSQQQNHLVKNQPKRLDFWIAQLNRYINKGADASHIPAKMNFSGTGHTIELSQEFSQSIRDFAHQQHTTAYVVLLTLFNLALNHHTSYKNVTIGLPVSDRARCNPSTLLGCFVNTVPYYQSVASIHDVHNLIKTSRKKVYSLIENQSVPYQQLVKEMRQRGWYDKLRFPVIFNYLTSMPPETNFAECQFSVKHVIENVTRCDLTLTVYDSECFNLNFDYDDTAFSREQIDTFAKQYLDLISHTLSN
ncbi:AMP-binding protein [Vibrio sp. S4M6]|uniref:non-ribosomal peptide synthetase n=1 Tax=Vibrio sinus TaxID=2946865 RepID=UPI002029EB40|nr:non-ribosomal peptide synthetase [Vibrio sinus]MCL9779891.1 AMP-binding protein [Vibrio sinus]